MRDHRERGSLAIDALEQRQHLLLAGGVQVARRLVEQQHARPHGKRSSDRDALLLAAGELRREVAGPIGETHLREPFEHAAAPLACRHARIDEWQLDIAVGARTGQQVVGLEHEADAAAAYVGAVRLVERGHLLADQLVRALAGAIEAAEDREQRRLA